MASHTPDALTKAPIDIDDDQARFAELAASLRRWPASNVVARKALDRAAGELMTLAERAAQNPGNTAG